jgi:hypothetical protein
VSLEDLKGKVVYDDEIDRFLVVLLPATDGKTILQRIMHQHLDRDNFVYFCAMFRSRRKQRLKVQAEIPGQEESLHQFEGESMESFRSRLLEKAQLSISKVPGAVLSYYVRLNYPIISIRFVSSIP